MLRMAVRIGIALTLAFAVAGLVGERLAVGERAFAQPGVLMRVLERGWSYAELAWPFALFAVAIAELLSIRALVYYFGAGALVAVAAVSFDQGAWDFDLASKWLSRWRDGALTSGLLGGLIYWLVHGWKTGWAGKPAATGRAAAIAPLVGAPEAVFGRCRLCAMGAVLVGLIPLAGAAWWVLDESRFDDKSIQADAERQGSAALSRAGYSWAMLSISDDKGNVIGTAPDAATRAAAFAKAKEVLAPMVGAAGIVTRLDDRLNVALPPLAPVAQSQPAPPSRAAAEADAARRTAAEAEARRRAAEEDAAKRRAAELETRRAAEAETRRKADEEARRIAAETEVKRRADEDARLVAAEVEAKRRIDEVIRRTAAEAESNRKTDDAQRLAAAAEAKTKADDAARSAAVAVAAAQAAAPPTTSPTTPPAARAADAQPPPSAPTRGPTLGAATATPGLACSAEQLTLVREARVNLDRMAPLPPSGAALLDRIAAAHRACGDVVLRIAGHANLGSGRARNLDRSQQLARRIAAELEKRGVRRDRLDAVGYGGLRAVAGDLTAASGQTSQRVEFALFPTAANGVRWTGSSLGSCTSDAEPLRLQFGSAQSSPVGGWRQQMDRIAAALLDCRVGRFVIEGHTDSIGNAAYNKQLSERRAEAVRRALVRRGVPAERLAVEGLGSQHPLDAGSTPQSHARNRRVDLVVDTSGTPRP
jgi:outer membrane protein OmpA-like peptidoglycan-associated protein